MEKWTDEIDGITSEFTRAFGALPEEQLNFRPGPGVWSIAQNLDHLMVINRSYFGTFSEVRNGTYKRPFMARFGFIVSFVGKAILKAVSDNRRKKTRTFAVWEPSQGHLPADILHEFIQHQEELKREIATCAERVGRGVVISSPANKHIVYSLEVAFDIIVAHERRHLGQAMAVLSANFR